MNHNDPYRNNRPQGNYPPQGYQQPGQYNQGAYAPGYDQSQNGFAVDQYGNVVQAEGAYEGDLSNPAVAAFAKRVYGYFAAALATATAASAGGVFAVEHLVATGNMAALNGMRIGALVAFFASFLFVVFTRKSHSPLKTGLLFVFAASCGFMIAPMITFMIAGGMGMSIVFAFGITTVIFGGITVYTLSTGKDFRSLGGYLFIGLLVVLALVIVNIFVPFPNMLSRIIMGAIVVLFVGYTLYDTSRVTRDYFYANDAVGAAMMLFYDFFILFKYILILLASSRD